MNSYDTGPSTTSNSQVGQRMDDRDGDRIALTEQVAKYWDSLRRGQIVPYRSEVDPRRIEAALGCTFIAEMVSPTMARLRIAGTEINAILGMETRGMPLTSMVEPASRVAFQRALQAVFDSPAAVRIKLGAPTGLGRPALNATLILLPMRDDDGRITRVMGCLETQGKIGRPPRRFEVLHVETEQLGPRPLRPSQPLGPRPLDTTPDEMAEAARPFEHGKAPNVGRETRVSYLRVIDTE